MRIGIAGDWHGQLNAVKRASEFFSDEKIDKIIQVGDYGLFGNMAGKMFNDSVQGLVQQAGQTIYITPGNHEDWDYINSMSPGDDGWCAVRPNVLLAPRGLRWNWGERTFVSLGGAPSVDRTWRLAAERQSGPRTHWWPEEAITDEDVDRVIEGGYADVMITHDAPIIPQIRRVIDKNPHGFNESDRMYALDGARRLHRAAHGVKPALLFHGHYHFPVAAIKRWSSVDTGFFSTRDILGTTRIIGLDMETRPNSLAILDTEDMSVETF